MPNTNCLNGIQCPNCGNEGDFKVRVTTWIEINDDGTGDHEDTEWDDDSLMQCTECDHEDKAAEFRKGHTGSDEEEE